MTDFQPVDVPVMFWANPFRTQLRISEGGSMKTLTTDQFVEAFAAALIVRGRRVVRLNDASVRHSLQRLHEYLDEQVFQTAQTGIADPAWRRSLVNIRNVFQPSPIGAFDRFESLMREKQTYLTEHPNPYYQDIVFRIPISAAMMIVKSLDDPIRDLVDGAVERYLGSEALPSRQAG